MFSSTAFWTSVAGSVFLVLGLFLYRRDVASALGMDKLVVLGPVFIAAPLATFGVEHMCVGRFMADMVPHWIPWHLFWIYFVGLALMAAALSFTFRKGLRWSAPLLMALFLIFVFTMDLPGTMQQIHNRIDWVLLCRETSFAAGAMALTGALYGQKTLVIIARILIGGTLVFYGVEHFLYLANVSGVPLEKITPAWFPLRFFLTGLVGAIVVVAGIAILINKRARFAAAVTGLVMLALVVFFYTPILATDRGTAAVVEGINYVFDTMLFAGTVLLLAGALPRENEHGL